jgi:hypothetical protein
MGHAERPRRADANTVFKLSLLRCEGMRASGAVHSLLTHNNSSAHGVRQLSAAGETNWQSLSWAGHVQASEHLSAACYQCNGGVQSIHACPLRPESMTRLVRCLECPEKGCIGALQQHMTSQQSLAIRNEGSSGVPITFQAHRLSSAVSCSLLAGHPLRVRCSMQRRCLHHLANAAMVLSVALLLLLLRFAIAAATVHTHGPAVPKVPCLAG